MIRVNIWLPNLTNVGHSSAQIGCDGEAYSEYVSWWPGSENILKPNPGRCSSEEIDRESEKSLQHKYFEFSGLREEDSALWWRSFSASDRANYSLAQYNCSWAVISALKAGGSDNLFPWHRLFERYNLKVLNVDYEQTFWNYIKHAFQLKNDGHSWDYVVTRPLVDFLDALHPAWSPRDVLMYCDFLDAGIKRSNLGPIHKKWSRLNL